MKYIATAYYPEHCEESRWGRDIQLMKENGINTVRILEFAWSRMEKGDEEWDFEWVHRVMRLLEKEGMNVVLCTPSAAPPVWLTKHHPETLAMDVNGHRRGHGARRHYCPSSRIYRTYCNRIAAKMQQELGGYKNILSWQIDNELGFNYCYCHECEANFRKAVKQKYSSLERLNEAWGTAFWSVDFWEWNDVGLPRASNVSPEMKQEFMQFYSDTIIGFMKEQYDVLRSSGCTVPITSNMTAAEFEHVDYWKMAEHVDFISWDNYSDTYTLAGNSMAHNLMRSLKKDVPYWTFENSVNSVWIWLQTPPKYNTIFALSAFAHGEEGHTFFRWDSCRFGHEQNIQGLVDWAGKPRAKLGEVKELREIFDNLAKVDLPPIKPRIAMIYTWQNYWGTQAYYGNYWGEVESFYQALFDLGQICDFVGPTDDLSGYDLVLTPGLCLVDSAVMDNIRQYVHHGGVLLSGRKTFAKSINNSFLYCDHPALGDIFGLRVMESQSSENGNDINVRCNYHSRPLLKFTLDGGGKLPDTKSDGWFEALEQTTADVLYTYKDGYFPGTAAVCSNSFGKGKAFYTGVKIERTAMKELMRTVLKAAGIDDMVDIPHGAQMVRRGDVCFVTNHTPEPITVDLPGDVNTICGTKAGNGCVTLPAYGYTVVLLRCGI